MGGVAEGDGHVNPTFKVFRGGTRILHSRIPVGKSAGPCADAVYCLIWRRVAVNTGSGWRGARKWDARAEQ